MAKMRMSTRKKLKLGSIKNAFSMKEWESTPAFEKGVWYAKHPYTRLFISFQIMFLNFYMFAEDPIVHSQSECYSMVIGDIFSAFYSPNRPSVSDTDAGKTITRFVGLACFVLLGMYIGKYWIHDRWLRDKKKMKMFGYDDGSNSAYTPADKDNGSWFVMFFSTCFMIFVGAKCWNAVVAESFNEEEREECDTLDFHVYVNGTAMEQQYTECSIATDWEISSAMGMKYQTYYTAAMCGTFLGDYITFLMVFDMVMQDLSKPASEPRRQYGEVLQSTAQWWMHGWHRIAGFWLMFVGVATVVLSIIISGVIVWDDVNPGLAPTTETGRALLASVITLSDLLIVAQDWEFPFFAASQDFKIAGTDFSNFNWNLWRGLDLHIAGKWFNYGIIFCVMGLDFNMLYTQIIYEPCNYGQFTDPDGHIYSIENDHMLDVAVGGMAATNCSLIEAYGHLLLNYDITTDDVDDVNDLKIESRFSDASGAAQALCAFPAFFGLYLFVMHVRRSLRNQAEYEPFDAEAGHSRGEMVVGPSLGTSDDTSTELMERPPEIN
eukprot:Rmarinus@m.24038